MNFLRNTLAIIIGLAIAGLIISLGIRAFPQWVTYNSFLPFEHWGRFLQSMQHNNPFFGFLLFISGFGTTVGGVATAIIVKYAKVAYAILVGFIMLFIAMLDIIIFPYHPTFYKICIFLTFFPSSWVGGKVVEILFERKRKRKLIEKMNSK